MTPSEITLALDLGGRDAEARKFKREHTSLPLRDFLRAYPARFPKNMMPSEEHLDWPLSRFQFEYVTLKPEDGESAGNSGGIKFRKIRDDVDQAWEDEQAGKNMRAQGGEDLAEYPERISDNQAVRTAYFHELNAIADYLRHGLSVLVACDKMLTEFIYEYVCSQAGKKVVLDTAAAPAEKSKMGAQLDQAVQGGQNNPLAHLPALIHNLRLDEVLVLRSLDMLDNPPTIELLYQRTGKGEKPQLLGFLDPSLEAKKVLTDRFAVHISLMGLPRHVALDGRNAVYTVTHLITAEERKRFGKYDAEGLYKNVSGLNAIQFRNAMQYVGAKVAPGTDPAEIYRVIRQFKTSSNSEIEIPDTTFENIGGYEHVKQQLQRIIHLIAGPITGMNEKQRKQLIPRGFIFHGPPGTGKTLFAKAIANEMNAIIQIVSGPEIMDKYVGQSEDNLRRIFATARRNAPAVIFFDEFDSIASQRSTYSDGGARVNNAVVAQLLTELDGFRQDQTILVIGTTNRIDIIDEALLRPSRLRPIEIGLPDIVARKHVARIHAEDFGVDRLLQGTYALISQHLQTWETSAEHEAMRSMPQTFLDKLFEQYQPYHARHEREKKDAAFLRELQDFFSFVRDLSGQKENQAPDKTAAQVITRLTELGKKWNIQMPQAAEAPDAKQQASIPMHAELHDWFQMLATEMHAQTGMDAGAFFDALLDLVAEYTENFNNDEIRAVFQEASLEYHLEGRLISPAYLGQKIGAIRKRRDERDKTHLAQRRR